MATFYTINNLPEKEINKNRAVNVSSIKDNYSRKFIELNTIISRHAQETNGVYFYTCEYASEVENFPFYLNSNAGFSWEDLPLISKNLFSILGTVSLFACITSAIVIGRNK